MISKETEKMYLENNKVAMTGEVVNDFEFDHESHGKKFYFSDIRVRRLSGTYDTVPIMVSEKMMDMQKRHKNCKILVTGQFRSYNKFEEVQGKYKLMLFVFAREIIFLEDDEIQDQNCIYLDGYICKEPGYRETPLRRQISDIVVAVNRPYNNTDYIPCIAWGKNAMAAAQMDVGTHIRISGKIQSREYKKKLDDGTAEMRTAYEVSVSRLEVVEEEGSLQCSLQ